MGLAHQKLKKDSDCYSLAHEGPTARLETTERGVYPNESGMVKLQCTGSQKLRSGSRRLGMIFQSLEQVEPLCEFSNLCNALG